jgi:predicted transcriptional regulator
MDTDMADKGAEERAKVRAKQAWELRERGLSYREIGKRLGVSHVAVKGYLDRTEDRLAREMDAIALRVLARDLAQVEAILSEAVVGYERSKEDCKRIRKRALPGDPPRIVELTLDSTSRPGDPRFLTAALAAIESRRKLVIDRDVLKRLDELEAKLDGDGGGAGPAPEAGAGE